MSTPRIIRATEKLLHQISRTARTLPKKLMGWLLRSLLVLGKRPSWSKAGFVLPTTVLLLLVVTLTVGAIGFRTFTRTQQTIGERQQRVIYNAATPVIDRAKSKLEFLFDLDRDPRGGTVPSQDTLLHMMLNDGVQVERHPSGVDPYTITDTNAARSETRIDVNNDGRLDNAWKYRADTNGDGTEDATVAYSIISQTPADPETLRDTRDTVAGRGILDRAAKLEVRNSPLSTATQLGGRCLSRTSGGGTASGLTNGAGWFRDPVSTTTIRKNFQVDVYVLPDSKNGTVATLEFQQDRQAVQGFKWAAWFRNDLEIFPGPQFNWNGAMHTEGNIIIGSSAFRGYMISAYSSCLYTQDASEITAAESDGDVNKGIPAFQGQFLAGTIKNDAFESTPKFDLWNGANTMPLTDRPMSTAADSVLEAGFKPTDFALEPVRLHTDDISVSRNPAIANPAARRDSNWENRELNRTRRMYNLVQPTPYVDDTFRADDRWGPKPRWDVDRKPIPEKIGNPIEGNMLLTGNDPADGDSTSVGLDGYWERRARRDGLRLVVGQRLELGDPVGWGGPAGTSLSNTGEAAITPLKEPLRPWQGCAASNSSRCNEARQRKTLWDNLASVQATAVYYSKFQNGTDPDFPLACVATTVHPGTAGTLDRSSTFENLAFGLPTTAIPGYTDSLRPLIISDFFRGRGTNGWEFAVPPIQDFRSSNSALRIALSNLAQFAGDPEGGYPSFPAPNRDGFTHPYPPMAMFGDFSVLRRVINQMDSAAGGYDALSPADKTALHTAGCTLGMLAYNLDYLEKLPKADDPSLASLIGPRTVVPDTQDGVQGLREYISLIDAVTTGDATADNAPTLTGVPQSIMNLSAAEMDDMAWNSARSNNPETYIRLLERWRDLPSTPTAQKDQMTQIIYLAQLLITREQVARDRAFGFLPVNPTSPQASAMRPLGECFTWNQATTLDPLRRLCSARPRYPVLYSLFPTYRGDVPLAPAVDAIGDGTIEAAYSSPTGFLNHGDVNDRTLNQNTQVRDTVDDNDPYIKSSANPGVIYKVVRPSAVATLPRGMVDSNSTILMGSSQGWKLPVKSASPGSTPNSNSQNLIKVCPTTTCSQPQSATAQAPALSGSRFQIPFKDSALYNGRELMSVRVLNLDLDLLRTSSTPSTDYWLPRSGIIYAAREDALSEAHIVRPSRGNWTTCTDEAALLAGSLQNNDNCRMSTNDRYSLNTDPPLNEDSGVSPKPVDFFPDPDRRPNGFRLRNGASLGRPGDNGLGLSFITDNPAYVQGPFNLHRAPGQTSTDRNSGLEEFITPLQRLATNFSNFYTRDTLDDAFSKPTTDQWRPSEVLADAVTPISTNFCDGSIEDSFTTTASNGPGLTSPFLQSRYGCTSSNNNSVTSYQNQPRASDTVTPAPNSSIRWMRTNLADSLWPATVTTGITDGSAPIEGDSPIFIHGSANPQTIREGFYKGRYSNMNGGRNLNSAVSGTQMNMIMVSGIVPSRRLQSYGGLHNFPRFLEDWNGDLFMSGAFLQLNFSTYATAPYDQESWQPESPEPTTSELIPYYGAPTRRWGYDVGLQYAPAGPVAQRFQFSQPTRSEFYSEPAASDPYIKNLCRSISSNC
jgi:hypothetical protein